MIRKFATGAVLAGMAVAVALGSPTADGAENPAPQRSGIGLTWSGAAGQYNPNDSDLNRLLATTVRLHGRLAVTQHAAIGCGLIAALQSRTQLEPALEAPGHREILLAGGFLELDTRWFLLGAALHHASVVRTYRGGGYTATEELNSAPFVPGFRARIGRADLVWGDIQTWWGPSLLYRHSRINVGVGAALPKGWGSVRGGFSYGGLFLEPTLTIPMRSGHLIVSAQLVARDTENWSAGLGTGFEFDMD